MPTLAHSRRPSPGKSDTPGEAVLLGTGGGWVQPPKGRHDTPQPPRPHPLVFPINVVARRPELVDGAGRALNVLEQVVALLLGLDGHQVGRGRGHELAVLLGLDPAHPLAGEEVAARAKLLKRGWAVFCDVKKIVILEPENAKDRSTHVVVWIEEDHDAEVEPLAVVGSTLPKVMAFGSRTRERRGQGWSPEAPLVGLKWVTWSRARTRWSR